MILGLDVALNKQDHQNAGFFPRGPSPDPSPSPRVEAVDCGDEAASWFSDFLGQPCRLISQNPNFSRDTKKKSIEGTIKSSFHLLYLCILCVLNRV